MGTIAPRTLPVILPATSGPQIVYIVSYSDTSFIADDMPLTDDVILDDAELANDLRQFGMLHEKAYRLMRRKQDMQLVSERERRDREELARLKAKYEPPQTEGE